MALAEQGPFSPPTPEAPRSLRILLADDEPGFHDITGLFIEATGEHEVIYADNGTAALRVLKEQREAGRGLDLALLDHDMGPGQPTGVEIARTARALHPGVFVAIHSANHEGVLDAGVQEEGVVDRVIRKSEIVPSIPQLIFDAQTHHSQAAHPH